VTFGSQDDAEQRPWMLSVSGSADCDFIRLAQFQ
jgi:hypothetical protein